MSEAGTVIFSIGVMMLMGFSVLSLMIFLEYWDGKCAVKKCEDDNEE